jgi:hypothetical protein
MISYLHYFFLNKYPILEVIAAVREKHKHALLLRDGCSGQITASPAITTFNKSKGRSILHGKYSAGCSMTQSWNDTGHGHDALHRLFEGNDFKFRQYADPEGANYAALKKFLTSYLEPASFKTYWAFICTFEPYIMKAITPVVIKSAVRKSGFEEDNKININTIMSFNPEFAKLSDDNAKKLVETIETVLVPYFTQHMQIPENIYDELLGTNPAITLRARVGTPLNNLTTNRQRFIIDNSDEYQEIIAGREAVKRAAAEEIERRRVEREVKNAALPFKSRYCSLINCNSTIDITTSAIRRINERNWKKCKGKNCSTWTCPDHFGQLAQHETICVKCNI